MNQPLAGVHSTKKFLLFGALVAFTLVGASCASSIACRFVPSYDTCRLLPQCAAVRIETATRPSWKCEARILRLVR
ncbi:MAG: hypothetical protein IT375_27130 [Polyangiaceae bacterium]|nr:hypothetical protein [Polyangiaceae bacterium]